MSLMKLLSAGKSLMSSGEPAGRYRLDTGYHLPKFGAKKNPFQKPAEVKPVAQVEMQMPAPIQKEAEQVRLSPVELRAAELKETQRLPAEEAVVPAVVTAQEIPAQEKVHPVLAMLDWMDDTAVRMKARIGKLELSKLVPKRKSSATTQVVQKTVAGPLQPELSLEKVRVIGNDLSDADLEIVAVKAEPKVQPKTIRRVSPRVEVNRMEAAPELIGAGQS
ncbi:MAG: hypothetical protein H7Y43_02630 [Akkermansiaceae bacterium]|nr:hypothetical protein [Verrucomicrobiales bacterium]